MIEMGKKYQTRDGRAVRILCVDGPRKPYPVVGIVDNNVLHEWTIGGHWLADGINDEPEDLIPATTKVEMWAVVYADGDYRTAVAGRFLFSTEAFAQGSADAENREHPSLTHGKAHAVLVTWNREDTLDTSPVSTKHEGWMVVCQKSQPNGNRVYADSIMAEIACGYFLGERIVHVTWED